MNFITRFIYGSVERNCDRCGKPYYYQHVDDNTICPSCKKDDDKLVNKLLQAMPKMTACACAGRGIKGHRCANCNNRGYIERDRYQMLWEARHVVSAQHIGCGIWYRD